MSNYPVGRHPRSADSHSTLRLAALTAVVAGVVLLAAAAFVLSYSGIHAVALQAGVSPSLAKLYPVIFDAMLVIAGAAAMALRGAGWWSRFYAWACLIALLAAVAIGDAVHATGTVLPRACLTRCRGDHPVGAPAARVRPAADHAPALPQGPDRGGGQAGGAGRRGRRRSAGRGQRHRDRADDGDLGHGWRGGHLRRGGGPFAAPAQVRPGHAAGAQAGPGAGHRGAPRSRCRGHRCRPARRPGQLRRGDGLRPPGQLPGRGRIFATRRFRWAGELRRSRVPEPGRAGRRPCQARRLRSPASRRGGRRGRRPGPRARGTGGPARRKRATHKQAKRSRSRRSRSRHSRSRRSRSRHSRSRRSRPGTGGPGAAARHSRSRRRRARHRRARRRRARQMPRRETIRPGSTPVTTPAARRRLPRALGWSGCGARRPGPRSNPAAGRSGARHQCRGDRGDALAAAGQAKSVRGGT